MSFIDDIDRECDALIDLIRDIDRDIDNLEDSR